MHSDPEHDPSSNLPYQFLHQLRHIHTKGVLPSLCRECSHPDSPGETQIALVLQTLLQAELRSGSLRLTQRWHLVDLALSSPYFELDVLLEQPGTGARGVVEVRGFSYHDRSPCDFDYSHRRRREIERLGYSVIAFTAREVEQDPWKSGLEVISFLNRIWRGFRPVVVPREVHEIARTLVRESNHCTASTGQADPTGLPARSSTEASTARLLETIAREVAKWPLQYEARDPEKRSVRSNHRRAGEPWQEQERTWLLQSFEAGHSIDELASAFQRQPSAIRSRLIRCGLLRDS